MIISFTTAGFILVALVTFLLGVVAGIIFFFALKAIFKL